MIFFYFLFIFYFFGFLEKVYIFSSDLHLDLYSVSEVTIRRSCRCNGNNLLISTQGVPLCVRHTQICIYQWKYRLTNRN